jgi:hypothetical protein
MSSETRKYVALDRLPARTCHSQKVIYCVDDAPCAFAGLFRADEGTRTLDLLHGKCEPPFAPVRAHSLKPAICGDSVQRERTRANPSERRTLPSLPLSQVLNPDSATFSATRSPAFSAYGFSSSGHCACPCSKGLGRPVRSSSAAASSREPPPHPALPPTTARRTRALQFLQMVTSGRSTPFVCSYRGAGGNRIAARRLELCRTDWGSRTSCRRGSPRLRRRA